MVHRSCSVELNNNSSFLTLTNPRVFAESGHCEVPPSPMVGPCSNSVAVFNKTTGAATGTVGVFTYDLFNPNYNDYTHVVAIMYSVPYDRNIYSNWCAVGVFERGTQCDYNLYDCMYNGNEYNFVRCEADGSSVTYQGEFVMISASMSESGEAVVRVDINDMCMY